jgi:coenzyme F420-reducing hydrogenase delta subunit
MMPCSSKIEVAYILKILESGADAVEIVACPEESCKFLVGSLRAERRVEYIRGLLEKIGYTPERVGISRRLSQSPEELLGLARARAHAVRPFGINAMKEGEL